MRLKFTISVLAWALLSWPLISQPQLIDKVAAVVGSKIILYSDVAVQLEQAKSQGVTGDELSCEILDQLLLEKLLTHQAQIDSIQVSEEEVENELDNRFRYYISLLGSEEEFEKYFDKTVIQFKEDFRSDVKDLLMARRMQQQIVSGLEVSPREVNDFFNNIPADSLPYFSSEVEMAQIVVAPKVNEEEKQKAIDQLRDIRSRIVSGENEFEALAKVYSEDKASGANGGQLGFMERGSLVKEYEAVAYKLQAGEVSDIVESVFGFHLIELLERRGNKINTRHILIRPKITDNDIEKAKAQLDSIKSLISTDAMSFDEAVEKYSEDEPSKVIGGSLVNPNSGSTFYSMDELDPELFFAIENLQAGEISDPVEVVKPDGSKAYRLVYLKSKTEPHVANLQDDYGKIQEIAQMQKQQRVLEDWISGKIKKTYVQLDESYQSCSVLNKWMSE